MKGFVNKYKLKGMILFKIVFCLITLWILSVIPETEITKTLIIWNCVLLVVVVWNYSVIKRLKTKCKLDFHPAKQSETYS